MRHYSLSTIIYFLLIILFIGHFQQLHSLRCKCNANRGPSPCIGDFCDIHNRDGKRAACGALRRARQTIFACVLIRRTSNDTYCHVIGSTTACWCREMDFCNADLEAELFDVDESIDSSEELLSPSLSSSSSSSSLSKFISNPQREEFIIEPNRELISTKSRQITIDVVEKVKLTPQKENPPTEITEIISDSYEYELDDE
ncbi:unnamed protein product [Acanthocheilonema viteae]|uniref:Activin types I and II receptor domain-containing protein n=1 Tax=Acanthocheilonema viteae TaxID=6277 RepID=A0A498SSG6_ACAVI|nr:unnamed protein product [Acanthocheilonema viteae]